MRLRPQAIWRSIRKIWRLPVSAPASVITECIDRLQADNFVGPPTNSPKGYGHFITYSPPAPAPMPVPPPVVSMPVVFTMALYRDAKLFVDALKVHSPFPSVHVPQLAAHLSAPENVAVECLGRMAQEGMVGSSVMTGQGLAYSLNPVLVAPPPPAPTPVGATYDEAKAYVANIASGNTPSYINPYGLAKSLSVPSTVVEDYLARMEQEGLVGSADPAGIRSVTLPVATTPVPPPPPVATPASRTKPVARGRLGTEEYVKTSGLTFITAADLAAQCGIDIGVARDRLASKGSVRRGCERSFERWSI